VEHTQFSIGGFDIVHVLHSPVQATEHSFTVSSNHGVSQDGSGVVEVSKIAEVPLGPGVHDKTSTKHNEKKSFYQSTVSKLLCLKVKVLLRLNTLPGLGDQRRRS